MSVTKAVDLNALIQRYERHRGHYRSGGINETELRVEFIDPLFIALGWDVRNEAGYAEAYKDVVHEDAIKVGTATKAPDYAFRIGGARKFFLETKKPSVDITKDSEPAWQLRRYAWSAKLPLSILTNFEHIAVYDTRIKPGQSDPASTARVMLIHYTEFADRWGELERIFSPESIRMGSFDEYAESTRKKRGTAEVDDAFLADLEHWRDLLARNIALRNNDLTQRELNYAVQITIDRIIFLRICEDRGIEAYGRLEALTNGANIYARLQDLFRQADERFNSGLFHFQDESGRSGEPDRLTTTLSIDDRVLKDILRNLYYPYSPYEFSALPADILGQIYERFLGSVIRLTPGGRAKVEEKPEVRKAGGVYYTPTYIVDYIVENTVGKLVEGKTPKQVEKLRILDPACGSGSFLIGAYQYLLDWHRDYYVADGPENHTKVIYQGAGNEWRLTMAERRRILLNNIYGVDIDQQAVEVTKLSLLLKALEGETNESLGGQLRFVYRERALPDLRENIKCGNSLIGPDFYQTQQLGLAGFDEEERYRINVFDWEAEFPGIMRGKNAGFDAVIGNPPYDVVEKDRGKSSWPHATLHDYAKSKESLKAALGGKLNLYRFFVIRSLDLVRVGCRFGMIIPLSILADKSCSRTRWNLIQNTEALEADCFPQKDNPRRRIFKDGKLSSMVFICKKSRPQPKESAQIVVRIYPWNSLEDSYREATITLADAEMIDPEAAPIPLVSQEQLEVCRKIYVDPRVVHLCKLSDIRVTRGEINQTTFRDFITGDWSKSRLLKGVEVGRYQLRSKLSQGSREWFDEAAFFQHNNPKRIVNQYRIATQRITGVDERLRIVAVLIDPPTYFADSTNSIQLTPDSKYDSRYLLGQLNSRLYQWRFKLTSTNNNVGTNELNAMPFRIIDFDDFADVERHDRMVSLVQQMLDLHEQRAAARTDQDRKHLDRLISATDQQIDHLVYELYDLTDEEIAIVEEEVG